MQLDISYSELRTWDTCRRQYYYSFIQNLRSIEVSEPMYLGTQGHKLLQNFYTYLGQDISKEEALKKTTESAMTLMRNNKYDLLLLKAWTFVDNYLRETDFSKTEAVIVENRFLFPLSRLTDNPAVQNVIMGFTPDVVFKRPGGFYDVEDTKFVGRMWSESKLNHFVQAKLYQIFLRDMGYNVSRSIVRFFNTQTSKITTKAWELKPGEAEVLINDLVEAVIEVIKFKKRSAEELKNSRRTLNNNTCQGCSFSHPCMLSSQGKDESGALRSMFIESDYSYGI